MSESENVRQMIKRLARIAAGAGWGDDLNPAQRAALEYLGRANRFSRAPSHVADYLSSTRGTVSQTLKSLAQKGYVVEERSSADKRSIQYHLTGKGRDALVTGDILGQSLGDLPAEDLSAMQQTLRAVLQNAVSRNGQRPFGLCRECRHFAPGNTGGQCRLLDEVLAEPETGQICHEQVPA